MFNFTTSFTFSQSKEFSKGLTFYEYCAIKDSVLNFKDNNETKDYIKIIDKFEAYSVYNNSFWCPISITYALNNDSSKSIEYLKKAVFTGFQSFDGFLENYPPNLKYIINQNYPAWRKQYLQEREYCTVCFDLEQIAKTDQLYREYFSYKCTDSICSEYRRKQKTIDSINELKLNQIAEHVIEKFFDIYQVFDDKSLAYTNLYIFFGHYSHNALLKYKDKILQAAVNGKCSWDLAYGLTTQLIFKFPCDTSNHLKTNYLYDIEKENSRLDFKKSYLTIYAMAGFLRDNPKLIANLVYFEDDLGNPKILMDIKKELVNLKIEDNRITISEKKYVLSKPSTQPKSIFGWQLHWK